MMINETIYTAILVEDETTYTFVEVCQKYHISKELLLEMVEQGLFNIHFASDEQLTFDQKSLRRMESAFRLHRDLGINLPGVALALDLLEELEQVRQELEIMRRHF